MRPNPIALLLPLLTLPLAAQTVWVVPTNSAVTPVLAQAAPGDVLQLGAQHPPFILNKGVLIRGDAAGTFIFAGVGGSGLPGPGVVTVNIPSGQQGGIEKLNLGSYSDGYGFYPGTIVLQSGRCELRDVSVDGPIVVAGGIHVLQRCLLPTRLEVQGGTCSISDSTLVGTAISVTGQSFTNYAPAISQTGGYLLASNVTATAAAIWSYSPIPPVPAVKVTGGSAHVSDSTFQGASVSLAVTGPGTQALSGNGNVHLARTSLIAGTGTTATPPSTGFVVTPAMVGMRASASPALGAAFTASATAGDSGGLLGVLGGFECTANSLAPFVEPLFGNPAELVCLGLALPSPGSLFAVTVNVPNVPALAGKPVFLQAVQLDGASIRCSTLVGGTMR